MRVKIELTEEDRADCKTSVTNEQVVSNPYAAVATLALELVECGQGKWDVIEKVDKHNAE